MDLAASGKGANIGEGAAGGDGEGEFRAKRMQDSEEYGLVRRLGRGFGFLREKRSLFVFRPPAGDGGEREHEFAGGSLSGKALLEERKGFRLDVGFEHPLLLFFGSGFGFCAGSRLPRALSSRRRLRNRKVGEEGVFLGRFDWRLSGSGCCTQALFSRGRSL